MAGKTVENGEIMLPCTGPLPVFHGGDPGRAAGLYDGADGPWLDLSTGINPTPYPFDPPPGSAWRGLPDAASMRRLVDAAADCYRAPLPDCVVAAPGSQALIQLLPRLMEPGRVAVLGPTYGEFAAAFAAAGHRVRIIDDLGQAARYDTAVIVNPNNPDGRRIGPERLAALAETLGARGGRLVVDEAFCDLEPGLSMAPEAARSGCVVLRSFGKFFGLAGARLGFAVAPPALARSLGNGLGPWAVSGPAAWIGARALADGAWIAETRMQLRQQAMRLDEMLSGAGLAVVGGTALFRLAETAGAFAAYEALARRGIFTRRFDDNPNWLRFGLPGNEADWDRLDRALAALG